MRKLTSFPACRYSYITVLSYCKGLGKWSYKKKNNYNYYYMITFVITISIIVFVIWLINEIWKDFKKFFFGEEEKPDVDTRDDFQKMIDENRYSDSEKEDQRRELYKSGMWDL